MKSIEKILNEGLFEEIDIIRKELKTHYPDHEIYHNDKGSCVVVHNNNIVASVTVNGE